MASLEEIKDKILDADIIECAKVVLSAHKSVPCIVLEDDGIIGFAGLKITKPPYSKKLQLNDYCVYVKPEKRSLRAAKMLSDACKSMADKIGLPLFMTHISGGDSSFIERWGYSRVGTFFSYRGA